MALSSTKKNTDLRNWRRKNPELARAGKAKWMKSHPGYSHAYYEKHKNQINKKTTAYSKSHRKERSVGLHKWRRKPENAATTLVSGARHRSKKFGVPFDLTIEWVKQKLALGKCEITGIEFDTARKKGPLIPTLDRTIPSQGYTKKNCKLVCWIYNRAKCADTHGDVVAFARAVCLAEELKDFIGI